MRSYGCYAYIKKQGKLYPISNTACWAGLRNTSWRGGYEVYTNYNNTDKTFRIKSAKAIYIARFEEVETKKYVDSIVTLINKVTPCEIVTIKKVKYIKYTLAKNGEYYSNLFLLNIIRMLWYDPQNIDILLYYQNLVSFRGCKNIEDPIKHIIRAVMSAMYKPVHGYTGWGNHSFIYENLKVKTLEDFNNYNFSVENNVKKFVTT